MDENMFSVLTPKGEVYQVPAQNLQSALNDLGGFLLDSGDYPRMVTPDGDVVSSGMRDAIGMLTNGAAQLAKQKHVTMVDPAGAARRVPLENINRALDNGFSVLRKSLPDVRSSETQEPVEGGLGPKIWSDVPKEIASNITSYLPFLNFTDLFKSADLYSLAKRARNGEKLTPMEQEYLDAQLADMGREKSWGYKVLDVAARMPAFALEFMAGSALTKKAGQTLVKGAISSKLKRDGGKVILSSIDDLADDTLKPLFAAAEKKGVSIDAAKAYAKKMIDSKKVVRLDDVLEHGAIVGAKTNPELAKKVLVEGIDGTMKTNFNATAKLVADVYGTADLSAAPTSVKFGQWLMRDNAGELAEGAKLWGKEFWAKVGTKEVMDPKAVKAGTDAAAALGRQMFRATFEAAVPRAILSSHRIVDQTYQNRFSAVLNNEDDDFWPNFVKAYGDNVIENFSEQTGESLLFLSGAFGKGSQLAKPFKAAMGNKAIDWFAKNRFKGDATAAFKYLFGDGGLLASAGWNGVIGEMAEEAVGGVLRMGTGLIEPGLPSFSDVTAMAAGFALNPFAGVAVVTDMRNRKTRDAIEGFRTAIKQSREEAKAEGLELTPRKSTVETLASKIETIATNARAELRDAKKGTTAAGRFFGRLADTITGARAADRSISAYLDEVSLGKIGAVLESDTVKMQKSDWERMALSLISGRGVVKNNKQAEIAAALGTTVLNYEDLDDPRKMVAPFVGLSYEPEGLASELVPAKTRFFDLTRIKEGELKYSDGSLVTAEDLRQFAVDNPSLVFSGIAHGEPTGIGQVYQNISNLINSVLGEDTSKAKTVANLTDDEVNRVAEALGYYDAYANTPDGVRRVLEIAETIMASGTPIQALKEGIFAIPVAEAESIGYAALSKGYAKLTKKTLLDSGILSDVAGFTEQYKTLPDDTMFAVATPGAISPKAGGPVLVNFSSAMFGINHIVEDMLETHIKKNYDHVAGSLFDGYMSIRRRVNAAVAGLDKKDKSARADALRSIAADVKSDNPTPTQALEVYSKYTTALLGFNKISSDVVKTAAGDVKRFKEVTTATESQARYAAAGLTNELPPAYRAIYNMNRFGETLQKLSPDRNFTLTGIQDYKVAGNEFVSNVKEAAKARGLTATLVDEMWTIEVPEVGRDTNIKDVMKSVEDLVRTQGLKKVTTPTEQSLSAAKSAAAAKFTSERDAHIVSQFEMLPGLVGPSNAPAYVDGKVTLPKSIESEAIVDEIIRWRTDAVASYEAAFGKEQLNAFVKLLPTKPALMKLVSTDASKAFSELMAMDANAIKAMRKETATRLAARMGKQVTTKNAAVAFLLSKRFPTMSEDEWLDTLKKKPKKKTSVSEQEMPPPPAMSGLPAEEPPPPPMLMDLPAAATSAQKKNRNAQKNIQDLLGDDTTFSLLTYGDIGGDVSYFADDTAAHLKWTRTLDGKVVWSDPPTEEAKKYVEELLSAVGVTFDKNDHQIERVRAMMRKRAAALSILEKAYRKALTDDEGNLTNEPVYNHLVKHAKQVLGTEIKLEDLEFEDVVEEHTKAIENMVSAMNRNMLTFITRELVRMELFPATSQNDEVATGEDKINRLLSIVSRTEMFPASEASWVSAMDAYVDQWRDNPDIMEAYDRVKKADASGLPVRWDFVSPVFYNQASFEKWRDLGKPSDLSDTGTVEMTLRALAKKGIGREEMQKVARFFSARRPMNVLYVGGGAVEVVNKDVDVTASRVAAIAGVKKATLGENVDGVPEDIAERAFIQKKFDHATVLFEMAPAKKFSLKDAAEILRYNAPDASVKDSTAPAVVQMMTAEDLSTRQTGGEYFIRILKDLGMLTDAIEEGVSRDMLLGPDTIAARFARNLGFFIGVSRDKETKQPKLFNGKLSLQYPVSSLTNPKASEAIRLGNHHIRNLAKLAARYDVMYQKSTPGSERQLRTGYTSKASHKKNLGVTFGDFNTLAMEKFISMQGAASDQYFVAHLDLDKKDPPLSRNQAMERLISQGILFVPLYPGEHSYTRGVARMIPAAWLAEDNPKAMLDAEYARIQGWLKQATLPNSSMEESVKRSHQEFSQGLPASALAEVNPVAHLILVDDRDANGEPLADGAGNMLPHHVWALSRGFGIETSDRPGALKAHAVNTDSMTKAHITSITEAKRAHAGYDNVAKIIEKYIADNNLPANTVVLTASRDTAKLIPGIEKIKNAPVTPIYGPIGDIEGHKFLLSDFIFLSDPGHMPLQKEMSRMAAMAIDNFGAQESVVQGLRDSVESPQKLYDNLIAHLRAEGVISPSFEAARKSVSDSFQAFRDAILSDDVYPFLPKSVDNPSSQGYVGKSDRMAAVDIKEVQDVNRLALRLTEPGPKMKLRDMLDYQVAANNAMLAILSVDVDGFDPGNLGAAFQQVNKAVAQAVAADAAASVLKPRLRSPVRKSPLLRQHLPALSKIDHKHVASNIANAASEHAIAHLDFHLAKNLVEEMIKFDDEAAGAEFFAEMNEMDGGDVASLRTAVTLSGANNSEDVLSVIDSPLVSQVVESFAEDDPGVHARIKAFIALNGKSMTSPFDVAAFTRRLINRVQRASMLKRNVMQVVAVPSYETTTFDERLLEIKEGRNAAVFERAAPNGKTIFGWAYGGLGTHPGLRYARRVAKVPDAAVYIAEENYRSKGRYQDLIDGDSSIRDGETSEAYVARIKGNVRTHEIDAWSSDTHTVIPGSFLDTNRVPTTMGSNFGVRLGYEEAGFSDELVVPQEHVKLSDSDFDVDKWYVYIGSGKYHKEGNEYYANKFMQAVLDLYDTNEGRVFMATPITTEFMDTFPKDTYPAKGEEKFTKSEYDMVMNASQYSRTVLGSAVSSGSVMKNAMAHNALSLLTPGEIVSRYNTEEDKAAAKIMMEETWKLFDDPKLGNLAERRVAQRDPVKLRNSAALVDSIAQGFVQKILDNAKNPKVGNIGFTAATAPLALYLMNMGYYETAKEAEDQFTRLSSAFIRSNKASFFGWYTRYKEQVAAKIPAAARENFEFNGELYETPVLFNDISNDLVGIAAVFTPFDADKMALDMLPKLRAWLTGVGVEAVSHLGVNRANVYDGQTPRIPQMQMNLRVLDYVTSKVNAFGTALDSVTAQYIAAKDAFKHGGLVRHLGMAALQGLYETHPEARTVLPIASNPWLRGATQGQAAIGYATHRLMQLLAKTKTPDVDAAAASQSIIETTAAEALASGDGFFSNFTFTSGADVMYWSLSPVFGREIVTDETAARIRASFTELPEDLKAAYVALALQELDPQVNYPGRLIDFADPQYVAELLATKTQEVTERWAENKEFPAFYPESIKKIALTGKPIPAFVRGMLYAKDTPEIGFIPLKTAQQPQPKKAVPVQKPAPSVPVQTVPATPSQPGPVIGIEAAEREAADAENMLTNEEIRAMREIHGIDFSNGQRILVASERNDPAMFSKEIIEMLHNNPGKFPAMYIITKHDGLPIRDLLRYPVPKYIHFSITGLGGTKYEPGVMKAADLLVRIKDFIAQGLDPRMVTIRVDPMVPGVNVSEAGEISDEIKNIIRTSLDMGITQFRTSVMDGYGGTIALMSKVGYTWPGYAYTDRQGGNGKNLRAEYGVKAINSMQQFIASEMRTRNIDTSDKSLALCGELLNVPTPFQAIPAKRVGCVNTQILQDILGAGDISAQDLGDAISRAKRQKMFRATVGGQSRVFAQGADRYNCFCAAFKHNGQIYSTKADACCVDAEKCASSCAYCYMGHGKNKPFSFYDEQGNIKDISLTQSRPGQTPPVAQKPRYRVIEETPRQLRISRGAIANEMTELIIFKRKGGLVGAIKPTGKAATEENLAIAAALQKKWFGQKLSDFVAAMEGKPAEAPQEAPVVNEPVYEDMPPPPTITFSFADAKSPDQLANMISYQLSDGRGNRKWRQAILKRLNYVLTEPTMNNAQRYAHLMRELSFSDTKAKALRPDQKEAIKDLLDEWAPDLDAREAAENELITNAAVQLELPFLLDEATTADEKLMQMNQQTGLPPATSNDVKRILTERSILFGDSASLVPFMEMDYMTPAALKEQYAINRLQGWTKQSDFFYRTAGLRQGILGASATDLALLAEIKTRLGITVSPDGRLYTYEKDHPTVVNVLKNAAHSVIRKTMSPLDVFSKGEPLDDADRDMLGFYRMAIGAMLNNMNAETDFAAAKSREIVIKHRGVTWAINRMVFEENKARQEEAVVTGKPVSVVTSAQMAKEYEDKLAAMNPYVKVSVERNDKGKYTATFTMTPANVFAAFDKSELKKKLKAAGRSDSILSPEYLVDEFQKIFRGYPELIRSISKKYGHEMKIGEWDNYFPLIYSPGGIMTPSEEAQYEMAVKKILATGEKEPVDRGLVLDLNRLNAADSAMWPGVTESQSKWISLALRWLGKDELPAEDAPTNIVEAQQLLESLFSAAVVARMGEKWNKKEAAAYAVIMKQKKVIAQKHMSFRTWSNRFEERTHLDYQDAYEKKGWLPKNLDPVTMLQSYIKETVTAAANRAAIQMAATSYSPVNGIPLVLFIPDTNMLQAAHSIIPEEVYENAARKIAQALKVRYRDDKPAMENLTLLMSMLESAELGYRKVDAPGYPMFKSVYAVRGDGWEGYGPNAFYAMKHLLGRPLVRPWPKKVRDTVEYLHELLNMRDFKDGTTFHERLKDRDMMDDIMGFTQLTKFINLAASIFFSNSAIESFVASQGLEGAAKFMKDPKGSLKYYKDMRQELMTGDWHDPELRRIMRGLMMAGYAFDIKYDQGGINLHYPQRLVNRLRGKDVRDEHGKIVHIGPTGWTKRLADAAADVIERQLAFSEWMFGDLFPILKTISAVNLVKEVERRKSIVTGGDGELTDAEFAQIANVINDGFGGQNWRTFWWATPGTMQFMNLTFRAPNWTQSAFRIGGGNVLMEKLGMGPDAGALAKEFQLKRYWPAMLGLVLMSWPNAMQIAIYGAAGDPDKDKPLTFQNEIGKRMSVDITPVLRLMPWYQGDPSGDRRYYMRWGKQVYEVWDTKNSWVADALQLKYNTLIRKMSTPVQMVYAMATGSSPGVEGWDLDFKDAGLLGVVSGETEGFAGSRIAALGGMLLPYSLSGIFQDASKLPFSVFGSVSKGTTAYELSQRLEKIFRTYADAASWREIKNSPRGKKDLAALSVATLEAAQANGYEIEPIVTRARSAVLQDVYAKFFDALDAENTSDLRELAASILRLNGTADSVERSFKTSSSKYAEKKGLTEGQYRLIYDAFGGKENVPVLIKEDGKE